MPELNIRLLPAAPEMEPVLANLLELYAHDFSEFYEIELGADGRFGYKSLPLYWREVNRRPFLIRVGNQLAGLALVKKGSELSGDEAVWDMAEFFVVRRYRRHGVGAWVAQQVWRDLPGRWEIRVMAQNHTAHRFWVRTISEFTGKTEHSVDVASDGKLWRVFAFTSPPVPPGSVI